MSTCTHCGGTYSDVSGPHLRTECMAHMRYLLDRKDKTIAKLNTPSHPASCPACATKGETIKGITCPWCCGSGKVSSFVLEICENVRKASPFEFVRVFGLSRKG